MRRPEYKEINIPEEVAAFAAGVQKVKKSYMWQEQLEFKYIIWPEVQDKWLVFRCYSVEQIKKICTGDGAVSGKEKWVTCIDVENKCWYTYRESGRKNEKKWGRASMASIFFCDYVPNNVALLHPEVLKEFEPFDTPEPFRSVFDWQQGILKERLREKQQKKDTCTNRLMGQAKPLPARYLKWHEETVMRKSRYIIYKRSNRKEFEAFCTHCESHIKVKASCCRYNRPGRCPACGSRVTMKSHGMTKHLLDMRWSEYVQAIQDGIMIRFVKMWKDYSTYGTVQRKILEPCRVVIRKGENAVWYEERESNTTFGSESAYQRNQIEGCIHPVKNYPIMEYFGGVYTANLRRELARAFPYHTFWQYKERNRPGRIGIFDIYDYFDAYSIFPLIESLEKTGKHKIADSLCEGNRKKFKDYNGRASTAPGMLGITRQQYRQLADPDEKEVRVARILAAEKSTLTGWEIKLLAGRLDNYGVEDDLKLALKYMTVKKFFAYAIQYDKYEIRNYYYDYLGMGERLGYDLTDPFVLFPRHIRQAHDAAVSLIAEEKNKKMQEKARKDDAGIAEIEHKIRKDFSYSNSSFVIRPARSAREIVREGQEQHICVGNGTYTNKMKNGKSYILFLRKAECQDIPFYTIEIAPNYEIIQRHGKYNQEGEEKDEVDRFLEEFVAARKQKVKR